MALYAFDGTWNTDMDGEENYRETNVVRFYNAYHANSGLKDFYVEGIGTRFGAVGRAIGGAFGAGELPRLEEAYDALCTNWTDGDRDIDVIGFSRGAATALDFCNFVQPKGIRKRNTLTVVEPSPKFRFIGLWDVVGAFNVAAVGFDLPHLNIGHKLRLPKQNIGYCFHAMGTRRSAHLVQGHPRARRTRDLVPRCPLRHRRRQRQPRPQRNLDAMDDAQAMGAGLPIAVRWNAGGTGWNLRHDGPA
jgi:hypothetical protein